MTTHEKLLQDHWGLRGELTRLGGENTNYLVTTAQSTAAAYACSGESRASHVN